MGKSLDGIKRLNPLDRERSRRLVLETIGEKEVTENPRPEVQSAEKIKKTVLSGILKIQGRRFDGIKKAGNRAENSRSFTLSKDLKEEQHAKDKENINKLLREKKEEEEKVRQGEARREEEKIKLYEEALKREAEKKRAEEVKRIKEADRKRREEREKLSRLKESAEFRKREMEKKEKERLERVIEEEKREKEAKAGRVREEKKRKKRREERKKKIKESAAKMAVALKRFGKGFKDGLLAFVKYSWLPVLGLFAVYFILYIVFSATLLVSQIDNQNIRRAGKFFPPVPALFTQEWVVNYFTYVDAMKESGLAAGAMDEYFIEKYTREYLFSRHGFDSCAAGTGEKGDFFSRAIICDEEINKISLARIRKIKEIAGTDDFIAAAAKYADKSGTARIADLGLQSDEFGKMAEAGEISPVIHGKDGYYILKFSGIDEKKSVQVDYVFVKAKTLDEYLAEKKAGLRVFKLVRD